jgi:hypothetical protein
MPAAKSAPDEPLVTITPSSATSSPFCSRSFCAIAARSSGSPA